MGAKQAYQKPQKAESKEVRATAKETQKAMEKKKEEEKIGFSIWFWPGTVALPYLKAYYDEIERIIRHFGASAQDGFIWHGVEMIRAATTVIAWIALIIGIIYYIKSKKENKNRKKIGIAYSCATLLTCVGALYNEVFLDYQSGEWLVAVIAALCFIYPIIMVSDDLERIDSSTK